MHKRISQFLLVACVGLAPLTAHADRSPNQEERAKIEQTLRAQGFTSWSGIELDDGRWEVDDAIASDGKNTT